LLGKDEFKYLIDEKAILTGSPKKRLWLQVLTLQIIEIEIFNLLLL